MVRVNTFFTLSCFLTARRHCWILREDFSFTDIAKNTNIGISLTVDRVFELLFYLFLIYPGNTIHIFTMLVYFPCFTRNIYLYNQSNQIIVRRTFIYSSNTNSDSNRCLYVAWIYWLKYYFSVTYVRSFVLI